MDLSKHYQPEIDGLRAVAITAAVFFHVRVPGFGGGFVGVDVFFVISGFLITRLLLLELIETDQINFFEFYARRIRRLFPALVCVVVTVLILGELMLSAAGERQSLSLSAIATAGFVSNIYFWRLQAFYFAGPAEWLPLLNMWTLSVEEQFYLVWPTLLALAAVLARTTRYRLTTIVAAMLLLLFVLSLAVFLWGATAKPEAAFYLTPTRVWEFALGGGLALAGDYMRRLERIAGLAVFVGLGAIISSVVAFRVDFHFASRMLPAAFGAAAVIAGISAAPNSATGRLLRTAPLVTVGKLSYSWYLWHWPLLSLLRAHDFGEVNLTRDLLVAFGSLGLAALTYVVLENPVRRRKPWPFSTIRQTVSVGGALSLGIAALALALDMQADATVRRDPWLTAIYAAKNARVHSPDSCHVEAIFSVLVPAQNCLVGAAGATPRILLWGDSHAQHFIEMIRQDGAQNAYSAIAWTMSACPPLLHWKNRSAQLQQNCLKFNRAVAGEIPALARAGVTGIVLSSRQYGFPGVRATPAEIAVWKERLREVLTVARNSGLRVLVIAPVPTFKYPVPECLAHLSAERCGIPQLGYRDMREVLAVGIAQVVAEFDNARLWDAAKSLCSEHACTTVHDGAVLFSDESHLSLSGSRYLRAAAAPDLAWLVQ